MELENRFALIEERLNRIESSLTVLTNENTYVNPVDIERIEDTIKNISPIVFDQRRDKSNMVLK